VEPDSLSETYVITASPKLNFVDSILALIVPVDDKNYTTAQFNTESRIQLKRAHNNGNMICDRLQATTGNPKEAKWREQDAIFPPTSTKYASL
jgi:hypothetical protein